MSKRSPWTWRRRFRIAVLLLLWGGAAYWFWKAYDYRQRNDSWAQAVLVDAVLDPEAKRMQRFPFATDCGREHGLFVILLPVGEANAANLAALKTAKGRFDIDAGTRPPDWDILLHRFGEYDDHARPWLERFGLPPDAPTSYLNQTYPRGDYCLSATLARSSPPVRVQVRYHLCGCERMVEWVAMAFGLGLAGFGAVVAVLFRARGP